MGMSNITDKVVVITGASSGIGESTAKFLAQQGARVVLGARRSSRIDAVVQEILAAGGTRISHSSQGGRSNDRKKCSVVITLAASSTAFGSEGFRLFTRSR